MILFLIILVAFVCGGFLFMGIREPGLIKNWLKSSRPLITLHYIFPTVFGIVLGSYIFSEPINFYNSILLLFSILFSFQTSVIINDINDIKTDYFSNKNSILNSDSFPIKYYTLLSLFFFIISIFLALLINYRLFLIVLFGHVLHFFYSSKPLRLKRFYPISIFMLSLAALLTAISGYALFDSYKPFISFPLKCALFIFIPLFLSLNFRDLADYRGDGKTNITTLFTIFGFEKGRHINAYLVLLSYLLVPLILKFYPLFIATIPLGILSFYFCLKKPFNEKMIFYIYFIMVAVLGVLLHTKTEIFLGPIF
ncbi:UbiA prenyltransferase family protein [candidate division WOR-3 bacterium]|nr:UbiA prenyltransferase family protein [candidate division WOR-3 bacterium]